MSRNTLREWQERNVPRLSKASIKQKRAELMAKAVKKYLFDKGVVVKKPPKEKKSWIFEYGQFVGGVLAHTRSEARAEIKKVVRVKSLDPTLLRYLEIEREQQNAGPEPTTGAA